MKRTMRQYQAVIFKLQSRTRDDEEALTDLLNERARTGWQPAKLTPLGTQKVLIVFTREA